MLYTTQSCPKTDIRNPVYDEKQQPQKETINHILFFTGRNTILGASLSNCNGTYMYRPGVRTEDGCCGVWVEAVSIKPETNTKS